MQEIQNGRENVLLPFGSTLETSIISANQRIREAMRAMLNHDHEKGKDRIWDELTPHMIPEGIAGSAQFDHACIAMIVTRECPEVTKYKNLTLMGVWKLFEGVLRTRGYEMSRGRVIGYIPGKPNDEPETAAETAAE